MDTFKTILAKINVLRAISKQLGLDKLRADEEAAMTALSSKNEGAKERLLNSGLENTNFAYLGGTIEKREEFTLQRLIFRRTNGNALVVTFPLEVSEHDLLRKDNFMENRLGYVVIYPDFEVERRIIRKVCESFIGPIFETSFRDVLGDLALANQTKEKLRAVIVQSKAQFVEYLNNYNPLRGME